MLYKTEYFLQRGFEDCGHDDVHMYVHNKHRVPCKKLLRSDKAAHCASNLILLCKPKYNLFAYCIIKIILFYLLFVLMAILSINILAYVDILLC